MFAWSHRRSACCFVVRPLEHGVLRLERRAFRSACRAPASVDRRIERAVQRAKPSPVPCVIAERWDDEEVAGARGGDVRQPYTLGLVARHFFPFVLMHLVRRPTADLHRAQAAIGIEIPACVVPAHATREVGEDDDGKLEAFGLVHGHQPHAVAALFQNRRLSRFGRRGIAQLVDETAKRNAAARFVLAGELGDVQHVGKRLLTPGSQDEADMRARLGEQTADRVRDRTVIAAAMQRLQQPQRAADWHEVRRGLARERELLARVAAERSWDAERMKRAESMTKFEQVLVVDREERSLQRGEDRQLVVRPLDRGQRGAHGLDFFAAVEGLAAHEEMRNAARLDRIDIAARDVFAEADEPAEQNRDVPRLDRHAALGAIGHALGDLPAVLLVDHPGDERADCIGQRFLNRFARRLQRAVSRIGRRHGQCDHRGL